MLTKCFINLIFKSRDLKKKDIYIIWSYSYYILCSMKRYDLFFRLRFFLWQSKLRSKLINQMWPVTGANLNILFTHRLQSSKSCLFLDYSELTVTHYTKADSQFAEFLYTHDTISEIGKQTANSVSGKQMVIERKINKHWGDKRCLLRVVVGGSIMQ